MNLEKLDLGRQIVAFIGPEGSGKTNNSKRLAADSGKPLISVSSILRDYEANDQTYLGDECRAMFAEHRYMDPEILLEIYAQRLPEIEGLADGFIIDGALRATDEVLGFPRVLEKTELLMPVTTVLLDIPTWMGARRCIERGRADDTEEDLYRRLSYYCKNLDERFLAIENVTGRKLLRVDATGSKNKSYQGVLQALHVQNNSVINSWIRGLLNLR